MEQDGIDIDELVEKTKKLKTGDENQDLIVQALAAIAKKLYQIDARIDSLEQSVQKLQKWQGQ